MSLVLTNQVTQTQFEKLSKQIIGYYSTLIELIELDVINLLQKVSFVTTLGIGNVVS